MTHIKKIIKKLSEEINEIKDLESWKKIKAQYLSKSDFFFSLKESVKTAKDKQTAGNKIKEYSEGINFILNEKKDELENLFFMEERSNPIFSDSKFKLNKKEGTIHPLTQMAFDVQDFFNNLNFHYAHGIEIENEKYNFDMLNLPKHHPARDMQDTFFLEEKGMVLRTHSTNITARELVETKEEEFKSYSIGPVFRNDDNDATHSFQFNQIDIFHVGKKINLSNLKWILSALMKHIFSSETKLRFRPSYFPFTEPSYEVDITWKNGWMEILGSGMLHNQVIRNAGKNPDDIQGYAAGIGLERIVMLKHGINDIRNFYVNDLNFLRNYNK